MIKQRDRTDERVEMRKMRKIRRRRGRKIPCFLSGKDGVADTDVKIAYQSLWVFTSSSLSAQILSSPHSPLVLVPFSFFPSSSLCLPSFVCSLFLSNLPLHLWIHSLLSSLPPRFFLFFSDFCPLVFLPSSLFQPSRPIHGVCVCVCIQHACKRVCKCVYVCDSRDGLVCI